MFLGNNFGSFVFVPNLMGCHANSRSAAWKVGEGWFGFVVFFTGKDLEALVGVLKDFFGGVR